MNKDKYFLKNTAIFALGNVGTKLINFFLVPLYTYVLTTEQYGMVDFAFSCAALIEPIIMCNIGEAVMRFLMDRTEDENEVASTALVFILGGIFLGLVCIPVFYAVPTLRPFAVQSYLYVVLFATHLVVLYYLRGKEQLMQYTMCSLLTTFLIGLFNILFLVGFHWGVQGYFRAYNLAYLIVIIVAIVWGKEYTVVQHFHLNRDLTRKMFRFSIALVPNAMLWWMVNSSDRIMVTAMQGVSVNGLYTVSYKIPSLLTMASGIFMQAWTYSAVREKQLNASDDYSNQMFQKLFFFMAMVSGGLLFGLKFAFRVLFAPDYFIAWSYAPPLILGFFLMAMSTFVGTSYYVEKNTVGTMLSALSGAVINVILNFILIPSYGALGASIATCISYFVILLYRLVDTRRYLPIHILKPRLLANLFLLLLMTVSIYSGNQIWNVLLLGELLALLAVNLPFLKELLQMATQLVHKKVD